MLALFSSSLNLYDNFFIASFTCACLNNQNILTDFLTYSILHVLFAFTSNVFLLRSLSNILPEVDHAP